ncbi:MAG: DUF4886 domain-containing protein [Paludibacteraceae bacterium]|nr:DUF4886 domain-containing protein [Paludibacteraceae bacterium]
MRQLRVFWILMLLVIVMAVRANDTVRVLCIGNSFSWDAVEQELYPLAKAQGTELLIGNLYFGGCSLQQHWEFYEQGKHNYSFRIIRNGVRTVNEHCSLVDALGYAQWDYISFQQASHDSGKRASYEPYLGKLLALVRQYRPKAQFCWMQTWSYALDATHPGYPYYQNSQQVMNDSIASCTGAILRAYKNIRLVPCGSAITYARESMGDILCRDGYHLSYELGRYVASCVWCEFLTGKSVVGNPYKNEKMTDSQRQKAQKAAHKAIKMPIFEKKCAKNLRMSKKSSTFAPAFEIEGTCAEKKRCLSAFEKEDYLVR